jgi:hypothetical protein
MHVQSHVAFFCESARSLVGMHAVTAGCDGGVAVGDVGYISGVSV